MGKRSVSNIKPLTLIAIILTFLVGIYCATMGFVYMGHSTISCAMMFGLSAIDFLLCGLNVSLAIEQIKG